MSKLVNASDAGQIGFGLGQLAGKLLLHLGRDVAGDNTFHGRLSPLRYRFVIDVATLS